jgi:histidine ammonia-lyase
MGTNSAVLAKQVLENSFQVMSIHIMAICQAIDLLDPEEKERLSPNAKSIYDRIRQHAHFVTEDIPQAESIAAVFEYIKENPFKL